MSPQGRREVLATENEAPEGFEDGDVVGRRVIDPTASNPEEEIEEVGLRPRFRRKRLRPALELFPRHVFGVEVGSQRLSLRHIREEGFVLVKIRPRSLIQQEVLQHSLQSFEFPALQPGKNVGAQRHFHPLTQ